MQAWIFVDVVQASPQCGLGLMLRSSSCLAMVAPTNLVTKQVRTDQMIIFNQNWQVCHVPSSHLMSRGLGWSLRTMNLKQSQEMFQLGSGVMAYVYQTRSMFMLGCIFYTAYVLSYRRMNIVDPVPFPVACPDCLTRIDVVILTYLARCLLHDGNPPQRIEHQISPNRAIRNVIQKRGW